MRVLGSRVEADELLCGVERRAQVAGGLELRAGLGQGAPLREAAPLAGRVEPLGEAARRVGIDARQQGAAEPAAVEVDFEVGAEAGCLATREEVAAERLAQAEQTLAQVGAGALGIDVGPEQAGEDAPRRRPLDRQVREQERVLAFDRRERPVRGREHGVAREAQGGGTAGFGHAGWRRRRTGSAAGRA